MELDDFNEVDDLDELDRLREKSIRTSASYGEMDSVSGSGSGLLSRFTPMQRLIIIALIILDIIVIAFVLFVLFGVISL